jgi:hypothetical protein
MGLDTTSDGIVELVTTRDDSCAVSEGAIASDVADTDVDNWTVGGMSKSNVLLTAAASDEEIEESALGVVSGSANEELSTGTTVLGTSTEVAELMIEGSAETLMRDEVKADTLGLAVASELESVKLAMELDTPAVESGSRADNCSEIVDATDATSDVGVAPTSVSDKLLTDCSTEATELDTALAISVADTSPTDINDESD